METIHDGQYLAEYGQTARGPILTITKPQGGGRYLEGERATEWAEAIETALDKREANQLCRTLLDN